MRFSDKESWDRFIYGLIYPGFLGSMLYEVIPTNGSDFSRAHLLACDSLIRYGIIIYYSIDYLHLYGDMDGIIKDAKLKSSGYFIVDILTCLGFVAAFIALNVPRHYPTIVVFGLVPWFFRWYKRENLRDDRFLRIYGYFTLLILIYRGALCRIIPSLILVPDKVLALVLVGTSVVVYGFYVFWFYEHGSREIDVAYYAKRRMPSNGL